MLVLPGATPRHELLMVRQGLACLWPILFSGG